MKAKNTLSVAVIVTLALITLGFYGYAPHSDAFIDKTIEISNKAEICLKNDFTKSIVKLKDWDEEIANSILLCESSGSTTVRNFNESTGDDSYGLFQINLYGKLSEERPSVDDLKNPIKNVEFAYELYKKHGWNDWKICYNRFISLKRSSASVQ